ncbi:hypothetical protein XPA_002415 [Xanthoria parietina]
MSALSPALPPPPGQEANFAHPESLERWTIVCVALCLTIGTVLSCLRCYIRFCIKRSWILEDSLVLAAWAGLVVYGSLLATSAYKHCGFHAWDLTVADLHQANYWTNVTTIVYGVVMPAVKTAILLFYRRIFLSRKGGLFDWTLRVFIAIIILFYGTTTLLKIGLCTPREKIWDRSVPGHCLNVSKLFDASGLFNWLTDILMLLVPVKTLWGLQMSARKKVGIAAVFTLGFGAPVFGIVGFAVRLKVDSSLDTTYHNTEVALWATAEMAIGLVCVCVPELPALAKDRRDRKRRSGSIVNGPFTACGAGHYRMRRVGSPDEEAPWGGSPLQQEGHPVSSGDAPLPPVAVITKIRGGTHTPSDHPGPDAFLTMSVDGSSIGSDGIYTSITMERSVQRSVSIDT